jgi:prepilin-type N-terminal cleavage/methylation domain-containing protein
MEANVLGRRPRGFTMVEVAVVMLVIGVIATLAVVSLQRSKPRTNLASTATELHALLRNARLNALATGNPTIVAFFPEYRNRRGGLGRIVLLQDPTGTFFTAAAPQNFGNYDPATDTPTTEVLERLDFPRGVVLASAPGAPAAFPAPFTRVPVGDCTFCAAAGDARGAVRFDGRGRATFYSALGAPLDVWGASMALSMRETRTTAPMMDGVRLFVISAATGGVKSFHRG